MFITEEISLKPALAGQARPDLEMTEVLLHLYNKQKEMLVFVWLL